MCTVTYLPKGQNGFILTSTRDEKTLRKPARSPATYFIHGLEVVFPRDEEAQGTWIASSAASATVCLLNGGFQVHEPDPPYRLSRGIVLLDYYAFRNVKTYIQQYDFEDIEPFTMLVIDPAENRFDEIRWDGDRIHHRTMDPRQPDIWSSVTLYTDEIIRKRNHWFEQWLKEKPEFSPDSAISFHQHAGTGDIRNDILMNRENVIRSLSITSVERSAGAHEMHYRDMLKGEQKTFSLHPTLS